LPKPRVLVADDYVELRAQVASMLALEFTVVAEVGDGQAALEAAAALRPDLVVLDLSMPVLSGLEAAVRLAKLPHPPGIVVLTSYDDPAFVRAACQAGASEFVSKARLSVELIPAMRRTLNRPSQTSEPIHAAYFYEDEEALSRVVAGFVGEGLATGEAAILIATPSHGASVLAQLTSFDPQRLMRDGDLVVLDAGGVLSHLLIDGMPNAHRFEETISPLMDKAAAVAKSGVVRAYGEMVDLLWCRRSQAAALSLETLWNQLMTSRRFALLCGYSRHGVDSGEGLREICAQHTCALSA